MVSVDAFITRWSGSGGSERANFQQFAIELTQLLDVPAPKPVTENGQSDDYRFERPVTFIHTATQSRGFIDLYRSRHFVMEAKQGTSSAAPDGDVQLAFLQDGSAVQRKGHGARGSRRWDDTMLRARGQADGYARAVAREDGWPPFLIVVDVGHVIELYADFSGQGQGYTQFPDGNRYRITMDDLRNQTIRERLHKVWTDPQALDPARLSAKVTREVADRLATLGKSLDEQGHDPQAVARFLMRCLFTMFAEDVRLIPENSFTTLLRTLRGHPEHAAPALEALWKTMNTGGFSPVLMTDLKRFNGGLFKDAGALPLNEVQLSLLIEAAGRDWKEVEPAIFGTLLERALSVKDRHKLGAHYTPRAYVERLVMPVIMDPLRADWRDVQAAALALASQDRLDGARDVVRAFHARLCSIRVLDPACGSGNFLYVALEMMKRLEGEVMALLSDLGEDQRVIHLQDGGGEATYTVDPHQFLGIELNPWAAAVAELVLWIGYLQWHFRTHGNASPAEPVLRDFRNIENRDAVLDWDSRRERRDDQGRPVTRWDGITTVIHPVTGEDVPDPAAQVQVWDYIKPRPAAWPQADFIVGNPPFIGASRMRDDLGDGYTEAIRKAYPKVPDSADFVMNWWEKAALAARGWKPATDAAKARGTRRFGFITTNSLRQTFNRRVVDGHLNDPKTPMSLLFAIPDHPWVDASDGAAVRIAMTVAAAGTDPGKLLTITEEVKGGEEDEGRQVVFATETGRVLSNLRIGADVASAIALKANAGLAHMGVKLHGMGFVLTDSEARSLGLGTTDGLDAHIRPFLNGRDLVQSSRGAMVIDLFGKSEAEVRARFPAVYQHVMDTVKPERDQNNRDTYKRNWWVHGEPRKDMRPALDGLGRFIGTTRTAKHRIFQFLPANVIPESKIVVIASTDAWYLAVLSCHFHVVWSLANGAFLEDRPNYNHSEAFNPFPFPDPSEPQKTRLRALGEQLDAHRKAQLAAHPGLTLTGIYNVLEKLQAGQRITGADRDTYDQGLIGLLNDLHRQIDAEVAGAYGWPADLSDDAILHRLVSLNRERAAEESRGLIRWLRPEYQNRASQAPVALGKQSELDIAAAPDTGAKEPWPKGVVEQMAAVRKTLVILGEATPDQVAQQFMRGRKASVLPFLQGLAGVGLARALEDGRFAARSS